MWLMSSPPLAMAEWGFTGEFGLEPTTYGAGKAQYSKVC
jgi:hypothetical protein